MSELICFKEKITSPELICSCEDVIERFVKGVGIFNWKLNSNEETLARLLDDTLKICCQDNPQRRIQLLLIAGLVDHAAEVCGDHADREET